MNYLLPLFIVYVFLLLLSIFICNGKLIAPSIIYFCSWIVTIGLALLYCIELEFVISKPTYRIVCISGFIFFAVELFFAANISGRINLGNKSNAEYTYGNTEVFIRKQMLTLLLFVVLFYLALAIVSVYTSTSGGSFSQRMSMYKSAVVNETGRARFRLILGQLYKVSKAIVHVVAYIWIYNHVKFKRKFITNWRYTILAVAYIIASFISQGARQPAIELVLFCIMVFISLYLRNVDRKKLAGIIVKIIPAMLALGMFYYYSMELAGRNKTSRVLLEYLAHNYAGGLYFLNTIINRGKTYVKYFGQHSFSEIYKALVMLRLAPSDSRILFHEFGRYGNTLTILGRWFEDFGEFGTYIMIFLVALCFCWLFHTKILNKNNRHIHLYRIIYCKLLMTLVWAGYDDGVRPYLGIGGILELTFLLLCYLLLIRYRVRFRLIRKSN